MRIVSGYLWAVTAASAWLTVAFTYSTDQLAHAALIPFWFGVVWLLTLGIGSVPFGIVILLAIEFRLRSALFFGLSGLAVGISMTAAVRGGLIYPLDDLLSMGDLAQNLLAGIVVGGFPCHALESGRPMLGALQNRSSIAVRP
jgi:hypothetical protein